MTLFNYWLCPKWRKTAVANCVERERAPTECPKWNEPPVTSSIEWEGSPISKSAHIMNYTALPHICNNVELTTQYRPPHMWELTMTSLKCRRVLWMQLKRNLMQSLRLHPAPFTKLEVLVPLHITSSQYIVWVNAFIDDPLRFVREVGDSCSATRQIVGTHLLASIRFSGILLLGKHADVLQAHFKLCKTVKPLDLVSTI